MPQQSTGGAVLRNGLIFGAIIAALIIGDSVTLWLTGANDISSQTNGSVTSVNFFISGLSALLGFGIFLGALALSFVAGMRVARRTGGIGSGSIAGLIAGASGALVGGVVSLIITITLEAPGIQPTAGSGLTQSQMQGMLIGADVFGLIIGLFQYGGFGAGAGALGGLVGRNSFLKANPQPYQPPFYPGYPGYPGGPWQPGVYYPAAPYPAAPYPAAPYPGPQYPASPYPGQQPLTTPYPSQAGYPAQPPEPQPPS